MRCAPGLCPGTTSLHHLPPFPFIPFSKSNLDQTSPNSTGTNINNIALVLTGPPSQKSDLNPSPSDPLSIPLQKVDEPNIQVWSGQEQPCPGIHDSLLTIQRTGIPRGWGHICLLELIIAIYLTKIFWQASQSNARSWFFTRVHSGGSESPPLLFKTIKPIRSSCRLMSINLLSGLSGTSRSTGQTVYSSSTHTPASLFNIRPRGAAAWTVMLVLWFFLWFFPSFFVFLLFSLHFAGLHFPPDFPHCPQIETNCVSLASYEKSDTLRRAEEAWFFTKVQEQLITWQWSSPTQVCFHLSSCI